MGVHGHHTSHIFQAFNKRHYFSTYVLIVDDYPKIPKLYGMENVTTEEVMVKLDMFQARFGKVDEFGWWYMERIQLELARSLPPSSFKKVFLSVNYE